MTGRHGMRLTGWILAANALAMLGALGLSDSVGEAARQVMLFCGLAR